MALVVNGEYVEDSLIREEANAMRPRLQEEMEGEDPVVIEMRLREWARENVIERVLLRQAALADPEPIPQDLLDRTVEEIRSQTPGQSGCLFPQQDQLRREIEIRLRIDRLLGRLTAKLSPPRNKEITEYYKKHRENFYFPEMVHAAHIVKNVDEVTDEATALAAIRQAQQELQQGVSFEEVADKHSDCPGRGGDLGFFPRGQMVEEFESVVFSMKPGEVSDIFRSPFGFHIAKIYEIRPEGYFPLQEVRAQIEEALYAEKRRRVVEQYLDKLRAQADVQNVPSRAAGSQ
ncbi:MAG: peptidylprolyl isomerase [Bryobacteraceae bacterium]|nr:peptidylprolyl isomerase [Bryobacteraceae bacterium]